MIGLGLGIMSHFVDLEVDVASVLGSEGPLVPLAYRLRLITSFLECGKSAGQLMKCWLSTNRDKLGRISEERLHLGVGK